MYDGRKTGRFELKKATLEAPQLKPCQETKTFR